MDNTIKAAPEPQACPDCGHDSERHADSSAGCLVFVENGEFVVSEHGVRTPKSTYCRCENGRTALQAWHEQNDHAQAAADNAIKIEAEA